MKLWTRAFRIFENRGENDHIIYTYISVAPRTSVHFCPLFLYIHQENATRRIDVLMLKGTSGLPLFRRKVTGDLLTGDDTATTFGILRTCLHNIRIESRIKKSYAL